MSEEPFDPQRHNRVLLHAWHTTHEVLYGGKRRHIHGLRFMTEGSTHDAVVFLTGDPTPVPAADVLLAPRIEP
jgi:hypothetical protein